MFFIDVEVKSYNGHNSTDFNFNSFIQQASIESLHYNITLKWIERLVVKELVK